jgi:hypothetical protein
MTQTEVFMSKKLNAIGLLSPFSKLVGVSFSCEETPYIPAIISSSFNQLKEKGIFILEGKSLAGTWQRGKDFLFPSDEDRFNENQWDKAISPLLTDIAKICIYSIPVSGDSRNMAIIKKSSGEYELRYFGFDFSWKTTLIPREYMPAWTIKNSEIDPPKPHYKPEDIDNSERLESKIHVCLWDMLDAIFHCEFHARYGFGAADTEENRTIGEFMRKLYTKYKAEIFNRLRLPETYNSKELKELADVKAD